MSLILDALNRARQETEETPGLATEQYHGVSTGGGNRRLILLLVALFSALLMIVWLLLDRKPGPAVIEPGAGQVEAASAPRPQSEQTGAEAVVALNKSDGQVAIAPTRDSPRVTPDRVTPDRVTPDRVTPDRVTPDRVTPDRVTPDRVTPDRVTPDRVTPDRVTPDRVAPDRVTPDRVAPDRVAPDRSKIEPAASDRIAPEVDALYREQQAPAASAVDEDGVAAKTGPAASPAPSVVEEEVIDIERLVVQARDELANAGLQDHDAPFLSALSQQTKDGIPTIMYQRHDYSGTPSQSNVVLNGKTLRVGAAVAGLKVEEILPGSVVLSYRGTRFRLRALNSWINL